MSTHTFISITFVRVKHPNTLYLHLLLSPRLLFCHMSSSEQTLRLSSSNLPLIPRSFQIPTFSHNATFLSRSTQYCTAHLFPTTQFAASWPVKRRMLWDSRDGEYKWTWITFCSCGEIGAESREKIKTAEWYYWAGETGVGLDRRKTNVASFMINFIHSVYRQELKLKKRNHFTTLFLYYFLLIYSGLCGLFTEAVRIFD